MTRLVDILPYGECYREQVLQVLSEAYATNPVTVALFEAGERPLQQTRELFGLRLAGMPGNKVVAIHDGQVVGFAHWTRHPPHSTPLPASVLKKLPRNVASRLGVFMESLRAHDLDAPHWHLGPVAVDPKFQGRGVARELLRHYCADPELRGSTSFLETDLAGNVELFSAFGFEVTHEASILGVTNWFMVRQPESDADA